nr:hypothetical protein CoNPh37_CDS0198 [Staphylococcus phage S-CoN_Ph37]
MELLHKYDSTINVNNYQEKKNTKLDRMTFEDRFLIEESRNRSKKLMEYKEKLNNDKNESRRNFTHGEYIKRLIDEQGKNMLRIIYLPNK